jgi:hypothetical protein
MQAGAALLTDGAFAATWEQFTSVLTFLAGLWGATSASRP